MKFLETKKIFTSMGVFVFLAIAITVRALFLQVIDRAKLLAYSKGQLIRETVVYPKRGNIYDRNGEPLALNIQRYGVFTIPKGTKSEKKSYLKLSKIVPELTYKRIREQVKKRNRYTWLARKIELTEDQLEDIKNLDNVYISSEPGRYYPNGELLSQTLGFVGVDNVGLAGIEFKMNEILKGEGKIVKHLRDAKGRSIKFESTVTQNRSEDLYLTIDKEVQSIVETHLKKTVLKHKAERGGVGVLNAETGEILALANYPTFDPNHFMDFSEESRKLAFITDPFEPGSVFKIFTVASALHNKLAQSDTFYYCEKGEMEVGNHTITEAETHEKFEWLSVSDIIKKSSNIGVTKIAFDLTFPVLKKTLTNFNLLERTGIELPGESKGIFGLRDNVPPLTLSNISFGQGIATTALQILTAYGSIANGGKLIRPTIIKSDKEIESTQVISEGVAKSLKEMLLLAVENGTGRNAKLNNFQIAGKTGTAQKASRSGGYKGYISSFVGFPVGGEKKYVVYVYIDRPKKNGYYAGKVAAPLFKNIMSDVIYKHDESEVIGIRPKKGKSKENLDKIELNSRPRYSKSKKVIPNFIGLDKLSAERIAGHFPLKVKSFGSGFVASQSLPIGYEMIENDKVYEIELKYERKKSNRL